MAKIRVYELAKDLDMSSKELLNILEKLDIEATSHMSGLEKDVARDLRERLSHPDGEKKTPPKKKKRDITPKKEDKEREKGKKKKEKRRKLERDAGVIHVSEGITVKELGEKLDIKTNDIQKKLLQKGVAASINQTLEVETVEEIASDYDYEVEEVSFEEEATLHEELDEDEENLKPRDPVITVMGHVDHGKTLLLDTIRKTQVVEDEAGGITQHIGAYHVEINDDEGIVFIDTPGHKAFTRMRARGASATDIVILVIAADDGIMPQTEEAINHARDANVPMMVAVNKMDKTAADLEMVKRQLAERNLVPEEWGGDTIVVPVSAKTGEGIDELLDMISLFSDMQELKANPHRLCSGTVIESNLESGRGPVATVLIKNGTLEIGDTFIAGLTRGKVRALFSDRGEELESAGPSTPVEVLGFDDLPQAGDTFQVIRDEREIRKVINYRQEKERKKKLAGSSAMSLDQLHKKIEESGLKELPIILKCDVQGTTGVIEDSLNDLSTDKVKINIIHKGVGAITESDIHLAEASGAIVLGFNVRPETSASDLADKRGIEIRYYDVIHELTRAIENAMLGMLEPETKEVVLGRIEVRDTFKISGVGKIAGCYVTKGKVTNKSRLRLLRDNIVVHDGPIASLRRFQDDVKEVKEGYECGISIKNFDDVKVGDILEAYREKEVKPQSL